MLARLLERARATKPVAVLVDALLARWARATPALRAAIVGFLEHAGDPRVADRALELLDDPDPDAVRTALGAVAQSRVPLDPVWLARIAAVAASHPDAEIRTAARRIQAAHGATFEVELASPDPIVRFESARALARTRDAARRAPAMPVLRALAYDRSLGFEQRCEAALSLDDEAERSHALLELGLQGFPHAAIQLRYLGAAGMADLERLAREAIDRTVRADAEKHLATAREIAGAKARSAKPSETKR
jgi:hypothetical protein